MQPFSFANVQKHSEADLGKGISGEKVPTAWYNDRKEFIRCKICLHAMKCLFKNLNFVLSQEFLENVPLLSTGRPTGPCFNLLLLVAVAHFRSDHNFSILKEKSENYESIFGGF